MWGETKDRDVRHGRLVPGRVVMVMDQGRTAQVSGLCRMQPWDSSRFRCPGVQCRGYLLLVGGVDARAPGCRPPSTTWSPSLSLLRHQVWVLLGRGCPSELRRSYGPGAVCFVVDIAVKDEKSKPKRGSGMSAARAGPGSQGRVRRCPWRSVVLRLAAEEAQRDG